MKYYKLIGKNYGLWPSFNEGEIYPEDSYGVGSTLPVSYWKNQTNSWQEVTEKDYLLQEAKKKYKEGMKLKSPTGYEFIVVNPNELHYGMVTCNSDTIYNGDGEGIIYDKETDRWAEIIEPKKETMQDQQKQQIEQMHKDLLIAIYSLDVPFNVKHELANKAVDALVKTSDHYMTKMIKP